MSGDTITTGLTALQADGLVCGTEYLRGRVRHVPVGRSVTGSQVSACVGCCAEDGQCAAGGDVR